MFIASIGSGLIPERMKIAKLLWNANISAEYSHLENPKFKKQLDDVLERGISYMVVIGKDELQKGVVKVKCMRQHIETEVPFDEIVSDLLLKGCPTIAGVDTSILQKLRPPSSSV